MIVCWVLFVLAGLLGLVSGLGYWHYQGKYDGLADLKAELDYNPYEQFVTNESSRLPNGFILDVPPEEKERKRRIAALTELDSRYSHRRSKYQDIAFIGTALAIMILLWNITWHIAHWVWMGRKVR